MNPSVWLGGRAAALDYGSLGKPMLGRCEVLEEGELPRLLRAPREVGTMGEGV